MHEAIGGRFRQVVTIFTPDINTFLEIIFVHCVVISRSLALYLFDPSHGWLLNNIDLYIPRHRVLHVMKRLHRLGYIPVKDVSQRHSHYHSENDIASVTMLTNGDHTVDLVESTTISALSPIFKFHLTAVMNYVSADGFFSAYPTLTTRGCSLINPMQFISHLPTSHMAACFDKYLQQGYDLRFSPQQWAQEEGREKEHMCRRRFECPHALWSTFDSGCLFIRMRANICGVLLSADVPPQRCFEDRRAVVWCLGGHSCDSTFEPLHPFSTLKGAHSLYGEIGLQQG
ncbi:hypothetical protein PAXINDRAFT_85397 [Paxillus involutus ATCC 200175]|uniref:Uncharacterized protein n=1 Tax=Paxillus involutus ATCC 200175 TaxID=664439 RepID=A0A0C9SS00_PAXIN|nr:hypothetical protein PAXINDRAFT_85397 [Paxillus involutus ATCC 200175]